MEKYVSDSSIDIKQRTFVLFSAVMLVALYLAIPAGLIMSESLFSTLLCSAAKVLF